MTLTLNSDRSNVPHNQLGQYKGLSGLAGHAWTRVYLKNWPPLYLLATPRHKNLVTVVTRPVGDVARAVAVLSSFFSDSP